MAEAAFDYLNNADLPGLPVAVQADCLKSWARLEAKRAAAGASLIGAFYASDGPAADGQRSVAAWLTRFTRCTKAAARGQVAASHRVRERRHVGEALAAGAISESYGKWIGDAVKLFDPVDRDAIEEILVDAAVAGALEEDLTKLAAAALRRLQPGGLERDEARAHAERGLTLSKTFGEVGRLNGDLDAEATALAETVIGALSNKIGPEDDRTLRQRRHDALAEACRRLIASDLLPERGGSKPHLKADIDLATLLRLPGSADAVESWIEQQAAALTRARINAAGTRELLADQPAQTLPPGLARTDQSRAGQSTDDQDGTAQPVLPGLGEGATLAGIGPIGDRLAGALACDATITPTVTGRVDREALAAMTDDWLRAHGMCAHPADEIGCDCALRHGLTAASHRRLQQTMLRWAIRVLSGPSGLASYLRTGLLDGPLAGSSIVLDVGADDKTVPAALDRAVRRRDARCRFPGCDHPAELSQVHHITARADGGPTELWNLVTCCSFHHLIVVHTWGWQLRLNPDGTTTATGPDGRVLHEHDPPGDPPYTPPEPPRPLDERLTQYAHRTALPGAAMSASDVAAALASRSRARRCRGGVQTPPATRPRKASRAPPPSTEVLSVHFHRRRQQGTHRHVHSGQRDPLHTDDLPIGPENWSYWAANDRYWRSARPATGSRTCCLWTYRLNSRSHLLL
jgi:hypothetical protein